MIYIYILAGLFYLSIQYFLICYGAHVCIAGGSIKIEDYTVHSRK
jgi:hypothetical protein